MKRIILILLIAFNLQAFWGIKKGSLNKERPKEISEEAKGTETQEVIGTETLPFPKGRWDKREEKGGVMLRKNRSSFPKTIQNDDLKKPILSK
ncbi:MAG: hypothetical protein AB1630_01480 [bacterium]